MARRHAPRQRPKGVVAPKAPSAPRVVASRRSSFVLAKMWLAYRFSRLEDRAMDRFAHEEMRVQTALLEIERQRVKLLILTANANRLREHAIATCADIDAVKAECVETMGRCFEAPPSS